MAEKPLNRKKPFEEEIVTGVKAAAKDVYEKSTAKAVIVPQSEALILLGDSKIEPSKDFFTEDDKVDIDKISDPVTVYGTEITNTSTEKRSAVWEYFDSNTERSDQNDINKLTNTPEAIKTDEENQFKTGGDKTKTDPVAFTKYYAGLKIASKPSQIIHVTHRSGLYTAKLDVIKKEAKNCININNIVESMFRLYVPAPLVRVQRNIGRSQCNQSVFNFPINSERLLYSPASVKDHLIELQYNINNAQTIIGDIINKTKRDNSVFEEATENAKTVVGYGQKYASEIVIKAGKLLEQILTVSPYIYPSINNHLYIGDYTDLFAFCLLSYLYKVDRTRKATEINNFADDYTKTDYKDILEFHRGFKSSQKETKDGYSAPGFLGRNDYENSEISKEASTNLTHVNQNTRGFTTSNSVKPVRTTESSGSNPWYKERKVGVFMKPGRFQKLILFTDTNFFGWRMQESVLKGLAMMVKAKLLPEGMFTGFKICSLTSGALYDLNWTKNGLRLKLNKCITYGNMSQTQFSQYACILDCSCARRINEATGNHIKQIYGLYPNAFYKVTNRYLDCHNTVIDLETLSSTYNLKLDIINSVYNKNTQLICLTRRHFTKALTDKPLEEYSKTANELRYNLEILGKKMNDFKMWANNFPTPPARGDYRNMTKDSDIPVEKYKKGLPYGETTNIDLDQALKIYTNFYQQNQGKINYHSKDVSESTEDSIERNNYDVNFDRKTGETVQAYIERMKKIGTDSYSNIVKFLLSVGTGPKTVISNLNVGNITADKVAEALATNTNPTKLAKIVQISNLLSQLVSKGQKQDYDEDFKSLVFDVVELITNPSIDFTSMYIHRYVNNSKQFQDFILRLIPTSNQTEKEKVINHIRTYMIFYLAIYIAKYYFNRSSREQFSSEQTSSEFTQVDEDDSNDDLDMKYVEKFDKSHLSRKSERDSKAPRPPGKKNKRDRKSNQDSYYFN